MKIGKENYPGFVMKPLASGMYYGWEPNPRQRKAGWKSVKLDAPDLIAALGLWKNQDEKLTRWKQGGERPREVKAYSAPQTFGAVLDRYEREKLVALAESSQRVDQTQLNYLRDWAGKQPLQWITRARVRALKLAICPDADRVPRLIRDGVRDIPGHSQAFKLLSKGREVLSWWNDHPENSQPRANPFERFDLPKPPARDQLWSYEAEAAFVAAADELGLPSIGFALELACIWGQREADILKVHTGNWRQLTLAELDMQRDLHDALASDRGPDAGKVMGFSHIQNKGRVRNAVPIAGEMRDRVEARIAQARKRAADAVKAGQPVPIGALNLIVRDRTGTLTVQLPGSATPLQRAAAAGGRAGAQSRHGDLTGTPWSQRDFIEKFGQIRDHAAATARAAGNEDLAAALEALEFRDARRTCVTRLANLGMSVPTIAAITGHSIKTVERIIETYLVRTAAQAGRGIVALLGAERQRRADAKKEGSA
ncbi:hypothetical protein HZY97_16070 [Sphingomonas sp. R-74633]|uniref:hypothetical protein n=1 Tax=Sphingomonas sp. R-74633 TaxID=2751188 RepID=UPI0015D448FE|nr:hypothetical protein [Sphingomonas sp. R-74633]NYT42289.1 hypothetical protein [Sphingomonas sp. R-74633]